MSIFRRNAALALILTAALLLVGCGRNKELPPEAASSAAAEPVRGAAAQTSEPAGAAAGSATVVVPAAPAVEPGAAPAATAAPVAVPGAPGILEEGELPILEVELPIVETVESETGEPPTATPVLPTKADPISPQEAQPENPKDADPKASPALSEDEAALQEAWEDVVGGLLGETGEMELPEISLD